MKYTLEEQLIRLKNTAVVRKAMILILLKELGDKR